MKRTPRGPAIRGLVLLCFTVSACADSCPSEHPGTTQESTERPNIVLIIGDDHDYRDFGFMGSSVARTPTLDDLAAAGTVYRTAYSTASVCRPALRTLLSGLHHYQYELYERQLVRAGLPVGEGGPIVATLETLPRLLGDAGYVSFQGGKHWEGSYSDAGFTHGMATSGDRLGQNRGWKLVRATMQPVVDFLDGVGDEPFFLWFAPMLPHIPHDAPAQFHAGLDDPNLSITVRNYHANIAWFDSAVATLLDLLEARQLRDDTLIVYVADNGWYPDPGQKTTLLGGPKGKASLYEPGFRTPLVFNWPGRIPVSVRDDLVSTEDLFPTLLDYAGAKIPEGRSGIDLRPSIQSGAAVARDALIGVMGITRAGPNGRPGGHFVRTPTWRYVSYEGEPEELYHIVDDPFEEVDVSNANPHVTAQLRRRVVTWMKTIETASRNLANRTFSNRSAERRNEE